MWSTKFPKKKKVQWVGLARGLSGFEVVFSAVFDFFLPMYLLEAHWATQFPDFHSYFALDNKPNGTVEEVPSAAFDFSWDSRSAQSVMDASMRTYMGVAVFSGFSQLIVLDYYIRKPRTPPNKSRSAFQGGVTWGITRRLTSRASFVRDCRRAGDRRPGEHRSSLLLPRRRQLLASITRRYFNCVWALRATLWSAKTNKCRVFNMCWSFQKSRFAFWNSLPALLKHC